VLTVHRLIRTSLLHEPEIRFPEGLYPLEDHNFLMQAFFKARRISILADYPCYFWRRRDDDRNASLTRVEASVFFRSVRDVLDIVDEHSEPGPARDTLYRHWYHRKALQSLRGRAWAEGPNAHELEVYSEIRRLALERFGPSVARRLPIALRRLSRAVTGHRPDLVQTQARAERGIRTEVTLQSVGWLQSSLRLSVSATMVYADGTPIKLVQIGRRLTWLPEPAGRHPTIIPDDLDASAELKDTQIDLVLRHRSTLVEFVAAMPVELVSSGSEQTGLCFAGAFELDLAVAGAGTPIGEGIWDLSIRLGAAAGRALVVSHAASNSWGMSSRRLLAEPAPQPYPTSR
jgi:hypothetical protein